MKPLSIHITEIEAGLVELRPDTRYVVPRQPYSAIYLPETFAVTLIDAAGNSHRIERGGLAALPGGAAHSVQVRGAQPPRREALQPPFDDAGMADRADGAANVVFAARVPTSANPVPDILPDLLILSHRGLQEESQLDLIFKLIRDNAMRSKEDRSQIMHRLAEIAAIILMEHVLQGLKSRGMNAAGGIGDPPLRHALSAMHERPEHAWTLTGLAEEAGMSRSVFASRFKEALQQSPMSYLARVRIARASRLLKSSDLSISTIAFECGYGSDSSFTKAFKRMTGASPSAYRNRR